MIKIESFVFNAFQENTYLLTNEEKKCWIVDPGMYSRDETNYFINLIRNNQLQPQAIINTHTHLDHIFGIQALIDEFDIPFGMNEKDMPVLANAKGSAMLFGFDMPTVPQPTFFIDDNEKVTLGNDTLQVRFTPGHSPGSISFYYSEGNWVLGGDVLFQGSIGRTDLPSGDFDTLIHSIRSQLFTLPDNTIVYSGHGPATTIGDEKMYNPFLK